MLQQIQSAIKDLRRRVFLGVARGVIRAVNDSSELQECQLGLLAGELRDGMERFQEYGYTSVPLPGAETAAVFVSGNRDHGIIVATDDRRFRLKNLAPGEVALYTDEGDQIVFKRGRKIQIDAGTKVTITAPLTKLVGDLEVTGDITDRSSGDGNSMKGMRDIYNTHTHPETGGGDTQEPGEMM